MKYKVLVVFAAIFALFSCSVKQVDSPNSEGAEITIRAFQEGATETRTTLIDSGTQVYWEPADEIKLFFRGSGSRFISQNTENARVAEFSGTLNVTVGLNEGASGNNTLWGLYPYRADATSDGESVTTSLMAKQTGKAGSFASGAFITLAKSNSFDLAFYNVCGGVRFSLTHEGIKRVTLKGNGGEALAGRIQLCFDGGVPVIQEVSSCDTTITLTAPDGETFQTGRWYYITTLPTTLSKGYQMFFYKDTESAELKSTSSVSIKRGIFGSLAEADNGLTFSNSESGTDPSGVIQFADERVKSKLIAAFDVNGDGALSYLEAAGVTSCDDLKSAFGAIKTYKSFDEFQYFTSITAISSSMFENWNLLSSITLPKGVMSIGPSAFHGCAKLASITIPDRVTSIDHFVFSGCSSLSSVILPDGVTAIGESAFSNCSSLTSISIPKSVSTIGRYAFSGCSGLNSVTLPENILSIEAYTFDGCSSLISFSIPESVLRINDYAFQNCSSLASIIIPESVKSIGGYAFMGCSGLSEVQVPSIQYFILTELGRLFSWASENYHLIVNGSEVREIVLPDSMTEIPDHAFYGCGYLTSVSIPESISRIGDSAFANCRSLSSISIPESVAEIGDGCFMKCSRLSSISLPESITRISYNAFFECRGLTQISIPETVTEIADQAFYGCSRLTSVSIPQLVKRIGYNTFGLCSSLSSISIPESVTDIIMGAFGGCSSLTSITIPKSVKCIEDYAFSGCSGLKKIIVLPETPPSSVDYYTFYNTQNCPIYVPAASVTSYQTASGWALYKDRIKALQ